MSRRAPPPGVRETRLRPLRWPGHREHGLLWETPRAAWRLLVLHQAGVGSTTAFEWGPVTAGGRWVTPAVLPSVVVAGAPGGGGLLAMPRAAALGLADAMVLQAMWRRLGGRVAGDARSARPNPAPSTVARPAAEGFGSAADATEFYTAAFRALVGALARKADGLEDAVRPCRRLQDLARSWAALTYLGDALGELSYGGPSGLRSRLDWIARRLDRHEDHAAALAARIGRVRRCADDRAVAAARALARELRSAANHAARGDVETAGFHAHDAFETFFLALGVETSPSGR